MRLYISVDIEGIVGVTTREHTMPQGFEWQQARVWMTDTATAAAEAAFAEGVEEVVISDSHGSMQNILIDRLPPKVQLVRGKPRPLGMVQGIEVGQYAGAMFLGWHTGSTHMSGVLGHTMRGVSLRELKINGRTVSEAGFYHALLGHFGVPLIAISGDDQFVSETKGLVGEVESSVVKWAYGHLSCRTLMPSAAYALVGDMARRAIRGLGSYRPGRIDGPITLEVTMKHRAPVELLALLPGVERLDGYTIRTVVPDMVAASKLMVFILSYDPGAT